MKYIILILVITVYSCRKDTRSDTVVKYEVTGTSRAYNVVYIDGLGNEVRIDKVNPGWSISFIAGERRTFTLKANGHYDCIWLNVVNIYFDGRLRGTAQNENTCDYAIAAASY